MTTNQITFSTKQVETEQNELLLVRATRASKKDGKEIPAAFVPYPYPGDIDGDGLVGMADFKVLEKSYGSSSKDANFDASADLNQDGWIDIADYAILSHAWGSVYPAW